jgi:hypothetical protein
MHASRKFEWQHRDPRGEISTQSILSLARRLNLTNQEDKEMAQGLPGADSFSQVTPGLVQAATKIFGQAPKFWGRYFKNSTAKSPPEYSHTAEDAALSQAGIRLLPVAQQTAHVNGNQALGASDAQVNAADFLATFPTELLLAQGGKFFMFLDVEGLPQDGDPSLSLSYYTGWAQTLVSFSQSQTNNAVTLLPCVYARTGDNVTWNALVAADANGIKCNGAWVARYPKVGVCKPIDFNGGFCLPTVKLPFPVFIWQYDENCSNIDLNQTNPAIADIQSGLLNQLVLPPGA